MESNESPAPAPKGGSLSILPPLGAALAVTIAATAASTWVPESYAATAVASVFFGATWLLVWRRADDVVVRSGLALGGLMLPGDLDRRRLARDAASALGWALLFAAVIFGPFFIGWRFWNHPTHTFHLHFAGGPLDLGNALLGQLTMIALPEEAFYRGYLQSRLDEALPSRLRVLGASVGPGLLVTSAIFAVGHFATIRDPARLAVFFPSLLFGWLRARTGGIGASVTFHALCNMFSELLWRGYEMG